MAYVAFSLKYRPRTFGEVIGQDHVSQTLRNAVAGGRVAHGYLFSGPRGTGKTSTARVLAKALNCVNGPTPEPCGVCSNCEAIAQGRAMDVIEIDAASNRGIEDIRELREKVKYSPAEARYKVYILDEVHMLTTEAFNALLKTLEEPPAHSYFILLTTEAHKIPATIISRCQRFDLRPISLPDLALTLRHIAEAEGLNATDAALNAIARASHGAMRDAESIFDQIVAYSGGEITVETVHQVLGVTDDRTLAEIADIVASGDSARVFTVVDSLVGDGRDLGQLLSDLTRYFRDLLRISLGAESSAWTQLGEASQTHMREQTQALGRARLIAAIHVLAEAQTRLKQSGQHALVLELALTELCTPPTVVAPMPAVPRAAPPQTAPAPASPGAQTPRPSQSAPAPTAAVAAPSGEAPPAELAAIAARWSLMPSELKRIGRLPAGAFIKECVPARLDGDTLHLVFKPRYDFHEKQVSGSYKDSVEEAIANLFGYRVSISTSVAAADAQFLAAQQLQWGPAPPPVASPVAAPGPVEAETPSAAVSAPESGPGPGTQAPGPPALALDDSATTETVVQQVMDVFEGSRELTEDE